MNKQKGITLIALVITIIVLLILAGISIAMLTGENGILKKAMNAKEETQIKGYYEKIELIRNELRLEKENYAPPSIAEMKEEFDRNQTDWVASTEIKTIDGIETLELITKEGYIFHITETKTEYKGKGELPNETAELTVIAKDIDISQIARKTQKPLTDLFQITWGRDGTGTVEYSVSGNLNFNNTTFTSTDINNLSELEIGNYTITCKVTSPSRKQATATKENVKVTKLANTTVNNASNNEVEASAIYSEYDLAYFRDLVNGGQFTLNGKLMNDIDLSNVCSTSVGNWIPIGEYNSTSGLQGITDAKTYYNGIFDGENHRIQNLYVNNTNLYRQGVFSILNSNAVVKGIEVSGTINAKRTLGRSLWMVSRRDSFRLC